MYEARGEVKVRGLDYAHRAILKWTHLRSLPLDAGLYPMKVKELIEYPESWLKK